MKTSTIFIVTVSGVIAYIILFSLMVSLINKNKYP